MPLAMPKPRIVILAGPNGAGKTTVSKHVLTDVFEIDEFVNADRIAAGLSAFAPESVAFEAGRIMLRRIDSLLDQSKSFAFETTLSSKSFVKLVDRAQKNGYHVELIYVALPTVALAKHRVRKRVAEGGHDIPADVIERRFYRGLNNLVHRYSRVVDEWRVFDNASPSIPQLILSGKGSTIKIYQERKWLRLLKLAEKHPM